MGLSIGSVIDQVLIGYMALFSIVNPFGIAFVYLSITSGLNERARRALAHKVGLYSFGVLIVSLLVGSLIMRFFGISVPALRIAGGLVVALSGWSMLTEPDDSAESRAVPTDPATIEGKAFFPLTVPLTTGPGSVATSIALGANRTGEARVIVDNALASLITAALVAVTIALAYRNASRFAQWVGREGTRVITRISAFLLLCVGVQIVLTGVSDALPGLIARGIQMPPP
jgi:multiple antibiotic resistance protein